MVPCLLTTTAFVTGLNGTTVSSSTDCRTTLNLYSVVVGPPTTGKSQAMKECAIEPLIAARDDNDLGHFLLERCTTSALLKCISEQKRGVVVSPEVYDVLNKMMKNEEENGSGEVKCCVNCSRVSDRPTNMLRENCSKQAIFQAIGWAKNKWNS